jgi:hypothetical protein
MKITRIETHTIATLPSMRLAIALLVAGFEPSKLTPRVARNAGAGTRGGDGARRVGHAEPWLAAESCLRPMSLIL